MNVPKLSHHEEYLRRKKKRRYIIIGVLVFILLSIVGLLSYLSHRKEFRIVNVNLFGGVLVTEEDVQEKTFEYLGGSYFWLFPKNNSFIYPKSGLEKYLKDNFKRIDNIDISLKNFQRLSIVITERKHFAIWCQGLPVANPDEETCYFIDKNSTLFAPAPNFSGDAYFKYYGLLTDAGPIGKEFISSTTQFSDLAEFVDETKKLSLKPQYVIAKGGGEYVMKLYSGTDVQFDSKQPLKKTLENLNVLLSTDALSKLDKGNLPVDYIDLRFGNKLYYKLKSN